MQIEKQGRPFQEISCTTCSTPKLCNEYFAYFFQNTAQETFSTCTQTMFFFPNWGQANAFVWLSHHQLVAETPSKEKMTAAAQCLRLQTASQCGEKPFQVQTAHSHTATCTSFFESNFQIEQLFEAAFIELPQCLLHTLQPLLFVLQVVRVFPSSAVQAWSDVPSTLQIWPTRSFLGESGWTSLPISAERAAASPTTSTRLSSASPTTAAKWTSAGGPPTSARGSAAMSATSATAARTAAATSKATFAMRNTENWKVLLEKKLPIQFGETCMTTPDLGSHVGAVESKESQRHMQAASKYVFRKSTTGA